MTPTLNLVGAGRVGQTLAHLWSRAGTFKVQDVLTRSTHTAEAACALIGGGQPATGLATMRPADVWMLAVPDAAIESTAAALAAAGAPRPRAKAPLVFHCSGAKTAQVLAPLGDIGWHTASAHPILSFASASTSIAQFSGTPCALEGTSDAVVTLKPAFEAIGAQCFEIQAKDKVLYHAAAVFATNFLPVLQSVAEAAWRATGVPAHLLPHLRATLLANAVHNITTLGPAGAQTGPAKRGDTAAIQRQADVVQQWDPLAGEAYAALSALALRLAGHTP